MLCIIFLSVWVAMSCNIADVRNLILKLKSKLVVCHVLITEPSISPENYTNSWRNSSTARYWKTTDSKDDIFRVKWTKNNGTRKICANCQINTYKLNMVVNHYQNIIFLKDSAITQIEISS